MNKVTKSKILNLFIVFTMLFTSLAVPGNTVNAAKATYVVISEVYGGGGNTGATLKSDFIELFNPTENDINLTGWRVQYASKTGTFNNETALSGVIKAGGYYLIKEASGTGGTEELITPDAVGSIAMSGSECKVRLVYNNENIIDFVGIGPSANESETSPTEKMTNSTSVQRKDNDGNQAGQTNGWDTDNNSEDFYTGTPTPRNSEYNGGENPDPDPNPDAGNIIVISEARAAAIGTSVKVKGIVTFKEASGSLYNYTVQDGTAGIAIRGADVLEIGDEVIVEGNTSDYKGLIQLQYLSLTKASSGNELPEPKEVTVTDIINNNGGENYESQRVKLSNVTLGEINTTGNTAITDDEGNTINIYKVPQLLDITVNDKVDVIGVCSQFTSYQIRVAFADDIVKSSGSVIEDKEGPVLAVASPSGLSSTNKLIPIKISYKDASEINKASLSFKVDDVDVTDKASFSDKYIEYTPSEELAIGIHKLYVELADVNGNISTLEAEIEIKEKVNTDELKPYFGQLHSHTNISDGSGSIDEAYKYAKEVAKVDFLAVTDHSNSIDNDTNSSMGDGSKSTEWVNAHEVAASYTDENFLGIYGYEMTWSNGTGHINTFNTEGFESRNKTQFKGAGALKNYYNTLKEFPASLSQWNHPGTTFGDFEDFNYYDEQIDSLITLIEVGNGEGAVRGSGYFPSYEYYTRALDKGWHVAPSNNQDNHKGKWGNANTAKTVILTNELNEENLYDALRNRRTYATEDENLSIIYTLNDEIMGSIIGEVPDTVNIKVNIEDPDGENIGKVSVIGNGGKTIDSKVVDSSKELVEFTIPANDSYYYIRVDQADKDIAVTAPVWIGETEKAGISETTSSTTMPIKGEEITIETSLYNNEDYPLNIESIEYSIDGNIINTSTEPLVVASLSKALYSFKYIPDKAGSFNVDIKVKGTINGVEKAYSDVLKLDVKDPSVISRVVVDATHYNDYVAGYYANNMDNFTAIANSKDIDVNIERNEITDELLKDAQLLIITAPAKKSGNVGDISYTPQSFSNDFIDVVKRYAENGGNIIVCGLADYQDGVGEYSSSTQLNKLLEAIGATTRINNDEVVDNDNKVNNQNYRLAFNNYNMDSQFLSGVVPEQNYSFYSGCSVALNNDAVAAGNASWLVKGYDSTYSIDSNSNTPGVSVAKGDVVALAAEKLSGGGNIFVAGTVFMSNFEVQASLDNYGDLQNSNYNIIVNILDNVKKTLDITPIKDVRSAEIGDVFCIEGYVTAGTQEGNSFFDTIYVQDETAGINVFPVSNIDLKVGQKVKVLGAVSEYEGEKELDLQTIEIIDENITIINPTELTTKEAGLEENKGLLVSVTGEVKAIGENNSGYIILNDGSGDIRIFLNGYIGASDGSLETGKFDPNIKVGDTVTAIGLASTDPEGARIRVRDSKEVTLKSASKINITIFHTNDTHGRIKNDASVIGIDTVAAIKASAPNSLLVDAGDTLHGLPFVTLNEGADMINLMKLAGYDLMTPGNHDFNYGYDRLLELATLAADGENGFNIISSNTLKDGKPILPENQIKTVNGIKIGFFGLTTPETSYKTNPNNVKGLEFTAPIETAKAQVESLRSQGADIIIALSHIGMDESSEVQSTMIADEVEGIDVIIDGHSHSTLTNGYEASNGTLIVSAGEYGSNIGKLSLEVDGTTKKVILKSAALISKNEANTYTPDETVSSAIKIIEEEQSIELSKVVGSSLVELDGERANVRTKETNLANLITDAMLYETGADVAITNGGGIRASIDAGEITRGEIVTVLPFGNYIVTKYLTGAQIKEVLEHGVSAYPESLGGFAQVGGLKFVFDDTKPAGERVVKITINGSDIDMNKAYLVATNDFLAAGGDNYPCFGDIKTENEFKALDEALCSYIQYLGDVNYSVEGRITVGVAEEIVVSKVRALTKEEVTSNSVKLSWKTPKSTVGLVEYVIYKDGKEYTTVPYGTNNVEITDLRAKTIYGFKVTARYSNGEESKPVSVNVRTKK